MTAPSTSPARAAPTAPPASSARKPRLTLESIQAGSPNEPDRILLMGTEGIGKTTFAASAPSPVFLCAESGIPRALKHVKRFPEPKSVEDVLDALRVLVTEKHDFQTVVIDTVDWLEPIVWATVCTRHNWLDSEQRPDIEKPGYGKGYIAATEEWRRILSALDVLRARRGVQVILLAHAAIKVFQNPAGADYARYECKLNKSAAALLKEWCDVCLFAVHEDFVTEKDVEKRGKGVSTGRRVIKTERCAAWDAKNRHGLPAELPLAWEDYEEARDRGQVADPEALIAEADRLLVVLEKPEADRAKFVEALSAKKEDSAYLARQVDRLKTAVAQKGAA